MKNMFNPKQRIWNFLGASILCVFSTIVHAADAEGVFWDSVVKGNAREEYELYLKQYPKGRHAQEARQKIDAMQKKARVEQDVKKKLSEAEAVKKAKEELQQMEAELKRRDDESRRREEAATKTESELRQREAELKRRDDEAKRLEAAEAELKRAEQASMRPGQVFRDCADCPEMVVIPAGVFTMGAYGGYADERPVHNVTFSKPFAMGKTEVTQAQWRAVMGNNPSQFSGCDDCPVERVSWNDAQDFVRRLSQKTGKSYRLPSEAEWEYACLAGGRQEHCGSDNVDSVAWYGKNSGSRTNAVAGKQPNGWGLYDMSGNVLEWVEDCMNGSYSGAPNDGRPWTNADGCARALRGGAWNNGATFLRATLRSGSGAAFRVNYAGFRFARALL